MKRREFFNKAAVSSLGLGAAALMLPKSVIANDVEGEMGTLNVLHEISRNHGHALVLGPTDLMVLFRRLKEEEKVSIDIQGQSRHPHSIEMTFDHALNILLGESVEIESSKDFGHTHVVSVSLKID